MSIHEVRIAHWRVARDRNGRELDLHPWLPSGATALIAVIVGGALLGWWS